jgi:hypothetical protein
VKVEGVVITDVRFVNEASAIRENCGKLLHIRRPTAEMESKGIEGHASEMEQSKIPTSWYDMALNNTGTIATLEENVVALFEARREGETT